MLRLFLAASLVAASALSASACDALSGSCFVAQGHVAAFHVVQPTAVFVPQVQHIAVAQSVPLFPLVSSGCHVGVRSLGCGVAVRAAHVSRSAVRVLAPRRTQVIRQRSVTIVR